MVKNVIQQKGASIATKFDKFKDVLFHEKSLDIYLLNNRIRTLAYFYKDSVTSCKEIQKDCGKEDFNKEDCDN